MQSKGGYEVASELWEKVASVAVVDTSEDERCQQRRPYVEEELGSVQALWWQICSSSYRWGSTLRCTLQTAAGSSGVAMPTEEALAWTIHGCFRRFTSFDELDFRSNLQLDLDWEAGERSSSVEELRMEMDFGREYGLRLRGFWNYLAVNGMKELWGGGGGVVRSDGDGVFVIDKDA